MTRTKCLLVAALVGCGLDNGSDNGNVVPIDASSDESGVPMGIACGELECEPGEACVEDASPESDTDNEPVNQRCVELAPCPVSPADCSCIAAACVEGLECVEVGVVLGQYFRCEMPADTSTGG